MSSSDATISFLFPQSCFLSLTVAPDDTLEVNGSHHLQRATFGMFLNVTNLVLNV